MRGLLRRINRGLAAMLAQPDATVAAVAPREPLINVAVERARLDATVRDEMNRPEIARIGLGEVVDERFEGAIDIVVSAQDLPRRPAMAEAFLRDFLPPLAERFTRVMGRPARELGLAGKVCAITGPAKGMGEAITRAFAAEGCRLAPWVAKPFRHRTARRRPRRKRNGGDRLRLRRDRRGGLPGSGGRCSRALRSNRHSGVGRRWDGPDRHPCALPRTRLHAQGRLGKRVRSGSDGRGDDGVRDAEHQSAHAQRRGARRQARLAAAGRNDPLDHLLARPAVVALEAVGRAAALAEWTGARIHILHISSAAELRPLAEAKARGVDVTGETCPC
ncbi:MAG: hypothetical protein NZM07_09795, partial [Elioraea sp.]|nr:hypothetical protein [Elioraea sp.]